ncbi:MAG: hypothetical protein IPI53_05930 [Saprospiraceae bacterium]|nr:hypothetical protein [Saprospiraceae bacterium]
MVHCAETNIIPYAPSTDKPWDLRRAVHLFRRTTFGEDVLTIKNSLNQNPVSIVNAVIDNAKNLPLAAPPVWANWTLQNYSPIPEQRDAQIAEQLIEWGTQWVIDMKKNGLRDKMSFSGPITLLLKLTLISALPGCIATMFCYRNMHWAILKLL